MVAVFIEGQSLVDSASVNLFLLCLDNYLKAPFIGAFNVVVLFSICCCSTWLRFGHLLSQAPGFHTAVLGPLGIVLYFIMLNIADSFSVVICIELVRDIQL